MSALPPRQAAEDGALELLCPLLASQAGYCKTIKAYNGETTGIDREDADFQRVTQGALPAILVTTGDGAIEQQTMGRIANETFELQILVASCNLRSMEARHRGDAGLSSDPGIYRMLCDIRERLWLRPLEADGVCFLRPAGDVSILRSRDRNIWLSTYIVKADATFPPISDEARDILGIDSEINFPAADDGAPANPVLSFDNEIPTP